MKVCVVFQESPWGWLVHWDLVSVFTLILAVVTLWLAYETRKLRLDAVKSIKAAETSAAAAEASSAAARQSLILSNRPKIIIRNVVTKNDDLISGPHTISGTIQIFNAGNTQAKLFVITCDVYIFETLPMHFPYDTGGGEKRKGPLMTDPLLPGKYVTHPFSSDKYNFGATDARGDASPARYMGLQNGNLHIFIMGEIAYSDDLDNQRITRFCRRYDRGQKRFFTVEDPDYETN